VFETGPGQLVRQGKAEEQCVPCPVPHIPTDVHVWDQLGEYQEAGLHVTSGLHEEEVQQRLVLLHEDAHGVEEGHHRCSQLVIRCGLTRPEELVNWTQDLLVDQDSLRGSCEDLSEEPKKGDTDFFGVDLVASAEAIDALHDVLTK